MKNIFFILLSAISISLYSATIQTFTLKPHTKLVIQKGDITKCPAEAIVNAANEQLLGGSGVCGACRVG